MARQRSEAYMVWFKEWRKEYDRKRDKTVIRDRKERRRREIRRWFAEIKANLSCSRCPEDFWACIEFHHVDGGTKEFTLADMVGRGAGKKRILQEMAKCVVLCSNCHKKEHFEGEPRSFERNPICTSSP